MGLGGHENQTKRAVCTELGLRPAAHTRVTRAYGRPLGRIRWLMSVSAWFLGELWSSEEQVMLSLSQCKREDAQ